MFDFDLILENKQIRLRPVQSSDFKVFAAITKNQNTWKYFSCNLSDEKELESWVNTAYMQTQSGTRLAFTIIYKPSNKILGSSSFGNFSFYDSRLEIGWTWLASEFHGKGINRQVKFLMLEYCFEKLKLERVEFKTDVLNIPARKALIKIGAVEEGILRSHMVMTQNRRRDTIYYSILKSEWPGIKENLLEK